MVGEGINNGVIMMDHGIQVGNKEQGWGTGKSS